MKNISTKELNRLIRFCQDYKHFPFAALGEKALVELKNYRAAHKKRSISYRSMG